MTELEQYLRDEITYLRDEVQKLRAARAPKDGEEGSAFFVGVLVGSLLATFFWVMFR